MTHEPDPNLEKKSAGWSELVEDTIGVNLRGIRTLWAMFIKPVDVFEASRTLDWNGQKYSSSLRVWTFLLAVVMFFQFVWATPESPLGEQFSQVFAALPSDDQRLTDPSTIDFAIQKYVFLYPVILLCLTFFASIIFRIWGKGTTTVERIRLFYAAAIPGMAAVLFTTPAVALMPAGKSFFIFLVSSLLLVFALDCITAYRGLAPKYGIGGRSWRAILFGSTMQVIYQLVPMFCTIVLSFWVIQKFGIE